MKIFLLIFGLTMLSGGIISIADFVVDLINGTITECDDEKPESDQKSEELIDAPGSLA